MYSRNNQAVCNSMHTRVWHFFSVFEHRLHKNLIRRASYSPPPEDFRTVFIFIFFLRLIFLEIPSSRAIKYPPNQNFKKKVPHPTHTQTILSSQFTEPGALPQIQGENLYLTKILLVCTNLVVIWYSPIRGGG